MTLTLGDIITREDRNPPRLIIYTPEGVGKTTLASQAPKPCFISTEDGEGDLVTEGFPTITSYQELIEAISALLREKHSYQTVVFDNISKVQNIIHEDIREKNKSGKGADPFANYGKGYKMAIPYFQRIARGINALKHKGMMVLVLGHAEIVRYEPPDTDPYDKFFLNLHKFVRDILFQECDGMFFGNTKIYTSETEDGRKKGATRGDRVLYTQDRPTQQAKSRFRTLPYEIAWPMKFDWNGLLSTIGRPPPWNRGGAIAVEEEIEALQPPSEAELEKAAKAKVETDCVEE